MIIKLILHAIQTLVERLLTPWPRRLRLFLRSPVSRIVMGLALIVIVAFVFGETFYTQPQLKAGDVAPQTIIAPKAAQVEDAASTEQEKQKARQVFPVLMLDEEKTQTSQQQLQQVLEEGTKLRQMLGKFPIIVPTALSQNIQLALRRASQKEWEQVIQNIDNSEQSIALYDWQENAVAQLRRQREIAKTNGQDLALRSIFEPLMQARQRYQTALSAIDGSPISKLDDEQRLVLLDLSATDWQNLKAQLPRIAERILTQGLSEGLPQSTQQKAFLLQAQAVLPQSTQLLAVPILMHTLVPNIAADLDQTRQLADEAARNVQTVWINVAKGDVIVDAGRTITPQQALLLENFKLDRRTIDFTKLLQFTTIVGIGLALFYRLAQRFYPGISDLDYALILLLALSTALSILVGVPSINFPMIGLLLGSFYNPLLALLTIFAISSLLPIGLNVALKPLVASLAGGILAAGYSPHLRSREDSVLLGIIVGLTQSALYFIIGWLMQTTWSELIKWTALYGLLGLAWCIVAIGISPYLERTFDLVTTIRLVELANLNRPLLKRLAAETPGTFQHTLAVANLAEAAGKELGCNVELIRTGTLYHDIGKMHDPLSFIENQMGRENKHDLIDNPWESAAIIKKHVTEGIAMAKRAGLPRAVRIFIPEHQGAQLISFFHHKALQRQAANPSIKVDPADFRYDGPNPQSRETGIVMLADSCEAALRSIKEANPEVAANMIQKIFRARWKEGALSRSGLTRQDLDRIAEIFLQVWQQSNHQRIAYPQ